MYRDPFRTLLPVSAFAQFEGCHDGDALGWPDAFEAGEIVDFPFAQLVQVVVAAGLTGNWELNTILLPHGMVP